MTYNILEEIYDIFYFFTFFQEDKKNIKITLYKVYED